MRRAVAALGVAPQEVLVDGNRCPDFGCPARAIVRGDALVPAISAASILAKEARDRELVRLDGLYPGYGLAGHKGYPTAAHVAALRRLGSQPHPPAELRTRAGPVPSLTQAALRGWGGALRVLAWVAGPGVCSSLFSSTVSV